MTRVIMHGCNGHMGQVITKLAEEDTDVEIVAGVDPFDDGHNSYPVFSSIEKYRTFFKEFEELFSKHKLWLDFKVRHKMLLMQAYFSAINSSLIAFNRIPLPVGIVLIFSLVTTCACRQR